MPLLVMSTEIYQKQEIEFALVDVVPNYLTKYVRENNKTIHKNPISSVTNH